MAKKGHDKDTIFQIHLNPRWDYSPHIQDKEIEDLHVPRQEKSLLMDFLERRVEGALLISGKRGVGKTSAVFKAVHTTVNDLRAKKIYVLPVLVNAPNFEIWKKGSSTAKDSMTIQEELYELIREGKTEPDTNEPTDLMEFKRVILQNLVRRLYQVASSLRIIKESEDIVLVPIIEETVLPVKTPGNGDGQRNLTRDNKSNGNQNESQSPISLANDLGISELFTRAVAKEVRKETSNEELEKDLKQIQKESVVKLTGNEKLLLVSASFVSAIVIALSPIPDTTLRSIISLLTIIVPSAGVAISWERKKRELSEQSKENKALTYYLHDYDISTLQSELEDTLKKLSRRNCKVIFVIDELDKMNSVDVIDVVKSLKTLFNQTSALFILITGQEFYEYIQESSNQRPTEYTLFSQRIFLQRPHFDDVRNFLDGILDKPSILEINDNARYPRYGEAYRFFKNYATFVSKTDFFDLYNVLRDHMTYVGNSPTLNFKLDKKLTTLANLQIALERLYLRKRLEKQSDWYKNDLLLDHLYNLLFRIINRNMKTEYIKIRKDPFDILFLDKGDQPSEASLAGEKTEKKFRDMESEALIDLVHYLTRLKYLVSSKAEEQYEIRGILEDVEKVQILTKEENDFLTQYAVFAFISWMYSQIYNKYIL